MPTSPHNNIFTDTRCLSQELLVKYCQGSLSPAEKKEVESHLLDCELCSKAVEGFMLAPVTFAELGAINKKVDTIAAGKPVIPLLKLAALTAAAASVAAVVWLALPKEKKEKTLAMEPQKKETLDIPFPPPKQYEVMVENPEVITILKNEPAPKKEKPSPAFVNDAFAQTPAVTPKTVEIVAEKHSESEPCTLPLEMPADVKVPVVFTMDTFICNLKVTDYDKLYYKKFRFAPMNTGIDAQFENGKTKEGQDYEANAFTMRADVILEKALWNVSKENYKKALPMLDLLLEHNPKDVNALFYSGISFFNWGKCKSSISFFDKVLENGNQTFAEEAKWYKALACLKCGNAEEGNAILKEIAAEKGFYSEQARGKIHEEPGRVRAKF